MVLLMLGMVVVSNADMPMVLGLCSMTALTNFSGGDVGAEIVDLEAGALEHHGDEVLADVVQVALDGADDNFAGWGGAAAARCGLGMARPPCIARADTSISGTKYLFSSNKRPTSPIAAIRPSLQARLRGQPDRQGRVHTRFGTGPRPLTELRRRWSRSVARCHS